MKKMSLNDRMKLYESFETNHRFLPTLPVLARLDGRCFHAFTKGLQRPYDLRFATMMVETTKHLMAESNALLGYTQSDEITLLFHSSDLDSQIFFDGNPFKMTSILAGLAATKFNSILSTYLPEKSHLTPLFDCRVWSVPNLSEAVNVFVWREQDATRNSISMAAQTFYSHKTLHNKNTSDMQEMLLQKGINWNNYPAHFRRGTYLQRTTVTRTFTCDEIEVLPPLHEARTNPDLEVERSEIRLLDMPPILSVLNRLDVVFFGVLPLMEKDND